MVVLRLTHSPKNSRIMKHKVELGLLWDLTRSLRCLKSEGSELGEEQSETGIVIVRISDDRYGKVHAWLKVLERSLVKRKPR